MQHPPDAPERFVMWGLPPTAGRIAMATQRDIVARLAAECERVHGAAVSVARGWQAVGGDVCAGEVVLERRGGDEGAPERQTRRFDIVVGADGVNSKVRELMQAQVRRRHMPTLHCSKEPHTRQRAS